MACMLCLHLSLLTECSSLTFDELLMGRVEGVRMRRFAKVGSLTLSPPSLPPTPTPHPYPYPFALSLPPSFTMNGYSVSGTAPRWRDCSRPPQTQRPHWCWRTCGASPALGSLCFASTRGSTPLTTQRHGM